jgi:FKBP-type peptidyl-prolyl cis-trans isomerase 2
MDITSQCVVELTWTLKDTLGEVLDELDEPVAFYLGGHDLLPKIEEALQGHAVGAKVDLHLEPEDAFGDFDENLLFLEPRALFPKDIRGRPHHRGQRFASRLQPRCTAQRALHHHRNLPRSLGARRQPSIVRHCFAH